MARGQRRHADRTSARSAYPRRLPGAGRTRAPLRHLRLRLDGGRRVGLTLGGQGVPLVFLHGISLNRRSYQKSLEMLASRGYFVIGLDAAGHGDSSRLRRWATWEERLDLLDDALDTLGVERAIFVGHSMGGRTAAALAARRPERALGAVLVNAALGDHFEDGSIRIAPRDVASFVGHAVFDTLYEQARFRISPGWLLPSGRAMLRNTATSPMWFIEAAYAILREESTAVGLGTMRDSGVPVAVLHGEHDQLVPGIAAQQVADQLGTSVHSCPDAWHSWLIASPGSFVKVFEQLMAGPAGVRLTDLRRARTEDPVDAPVGCLSDDALARSLAPAFRLIPLRRQVLPRQARLEFAEVQRAVRAAETG